MPSLQRYSFQKNEFDGFYSFDRSPANVGINKKITENRRSTT